jgi:hypothetical protein
MRGLAHGAITVCENVTPDFWVFLETKVILFCLFGRMMDYYILLHALLYFLYIYIHTIHSTGCIIYLSTVLHWLYSKRVKTWGFLLIGSAHVHEPKTWFLSRQLVINYFGRKVSGSAVRSKREGFLPLTMLHGGLWSN